MHGSPAAFARKDQPPAHVDPSVTQHETSAAPLGRRTTAARLARAVVLAALPAAAVASCDSGGSTEIVVAVSSQLRGPAELTAVRVVAQGEGRPPACVTLRRDGSAPLLPQTVPLRGTPGESVRVVVAGYGDALAVPADPCAIGDRARVVRSARTTFDGGYRLMLPMPLRRACSEVSCGDGETCAGGECHPSEVPSASLIRYADDRAFPTSSYCFSRAACFEDVVPAVLVGPEDCTFELPSEVHLEERLNVEILHDDLSREILDLDPLEGFLRVPERLDRFRLAPGLCRRYQARTIAALYVGANCLPKHPLRPLCPPPTPAPDAGPPPFEDTACTSPAELRPTAAALYFVVDRSRSMREAFGVGSPLREALELTLRAPYARAVTAGMRLMPADAAACTSEPNPFADPRGDAAAPLTAARDASRLVGALLGDAQRVAPSDAPVMLDAALRSNGAYAALERIPGDRGRRMVVAVGNRDFFGGCNASPGSPPQLAFLANRDRGLSTGALLLRAPPDATTNRDAYVDAITMAHAGGGPFLDGSFDDNQLRAAVVALITEVTSCLYDAPPGLPASGARDARLSYFDVLRSSRVDIAHDPGCNARQGDGWNFDGDKIRICGKACGDLRMTMNAAGTYAVTHHVAPVDIPLKWSPPCAR